jgi:HEAT repeat protein
MNTMSTIRWTAVVIIILASGALSRDITPSFTGELDDALRAISLRRSDLRFRTDHTDSMAFPLRLMNRAFADPVPFIDTVHTMCTRLSNTAMPSSMIAVTSRWLDLTLPSRGAAPRVSVIPDTSEVNRAINNLAAAIVYASHEHERAFAGLTLSERDSLRTWIDGFFGEDNGDDRSVDIFTMRANEHAERERSRRRLALAARVDRARIIAAGYAVTSATEVLTRAILADTPGTWHHLAGARWHTSAGDIVIGSSGDDRHASDAAVSIDPAGNDTWIAPAKPSPGIRVIIDVRGNDRYEGSVAAGYMGCGVVMDLAGNDHYQGATYAQGTGIFGTGILFDRSGNDLYRADRSAQGCGLFGVGLLVDQSGNDTYQVGNYAQGIGGTAGVGVIIDRSGHDTYLSGGNSVDVLRGADHSVTMTQGVGLGVRPVGSGGIGLLIDSRGNDTYVADVFGQGVAYWFGIGALVDDGGHDRYLAHMYAQGSGVHLAMGLLIDSNGNDLYNASGVSQGCGHDISFGTLIDLAGDDTYTAEGLSQGAGNANGISLLVDMSGRDIYAARRPDVLGYSDRRREYGMAGIVLDLDGTDRYAAPWGADGTWWTHSTYGVGVDLSARARPTTTTTRAKAKKRDVESELCTDPESLYVQASNPVARYRYLIEPAEAKLVARNRELVTFWEGKLGSESARERHALIRIQQKAFAKGDTASVPLLIDSLDARVGRSRRMAAYLLGFSRAKNPVMPLADLLSHTDWKTRRTAALSLWRLKDPRAQHSLITAISDSVPLVRQGAAYALGTTGDPTGVPHLIRALADTSHMVRYAAQQSLVKLRPDPRLLVPAVRSGEPAAVHALAVIEADTIRGVSVLPAVIKALGPTYPWPVRARAAKVLSRWGTVTAVKSLRRSLETATNPYLIQCLNEAIKHIEVIDQTPRKAAR